MNHSGRRCHIRVVDDFDDNRALWRAIFETARISVTCVNAVQKARLQLQSETNFDLVLSDISMPEESGFDLLEWMRAQEERIRITPVLFITAAMPEDHHRVHGLMLGAVDYIVRPISNQELVLRVRIAIDHFQRYQELRNSLESSEDMAMTGRILAAANHEIRNLTSLILLTSERAMTTVQRGQPMSQGSTGYDAIQALHKTARLLADVSRNLNAHVTNEPVHVETLPLQPIVQDVLELVRPRLTHVNIDAQLTAIDDFAFADPTRLTQVLINFVFNAHDAILERGAAGGKITVRLVEETDGEISVLVTDNGIGLQKREVRSDFQPFRTTKSVRGGKGLGLWLCSRFAQAMGGSISLESAGPGTGSTARISLRKARKPEEFKLRIEDYLMD